jgi:hypothetical protein
MKTEKGNEELLIAAAVVLVVCAGFFCWVFIGARTAVDPVPSGGVEETPSEAPQNAPGSGDVSQKKEEHPGIEDQDGDGVVCTQEVKECPDGSYVGRTGPRCDFAACPVGAPGEAAEGRKTYANEAFGFLFTYPKEWTIDDERSSSGEVVFDVGIPESREAIAFRRDAQGLSLDQLAKEKVPDAAVIARQYSLTVGGEQARAVETTEFGTTYVFFRHSDTVFTITTGGRLLSEVVLDSFVFPK